MSRGPAGPLERSWSGKGVPWTWALAPLALGYGALTAVSRARAKRSRRRLPGARVIAIGGLTVGGSGKSSVAGWLAAELHARGAAPAVLLRGHGAARPSNGPYVIPDYEGYPGSEALARAGDEAAAHQARLPRDVPVAAGRDRFASARRARDGYGARIAILDDGWEQATLLWDELWVVLDPANPVGNGAPLPAGPLRRPISTLREAAVIAWIQEEGEGPSEFGRMERLRASAPGAATVRFRRVLGSVSPLGVRSSSPAPAAAGSLPPALLVSGIGSPERFERFARGAGIRVLSHAAFPDHASWTARQIEAVVGEAARKGAGVVLTTEKDEARWPAGAPGGLPVFVLRTSLQPLDPVDAVLARACGAMASPAAIG